MLTGNILIVDDEKGIRDGLKLFLKREGHLTFTAEDGKEALEILEKNDIDLVISDLRMPHINGDELLAFIKKDYPGVKVIILTGHGTVENAVEAMRNGDSDVQEMKMEYNVRRKYLLKRFGEMGVDCFEALGAFYVFPCVKEFGMSSEDFATAMLKSKKVCVVPGTAFGNCGEGFLRISYAYSMETVEYFMI